MPTSAGFVPIAIDVVVMPPGEATDANSIEHHEVITLAHLAGLSRRAIPFGAVPPA